MFAYSPVCTRLNQFVLVFFSFVFGAQGMAAAQASYPPALPEGIDPSKDYHSFANTHEMAIDHLVLDLDVNFERKQLSGSVTLNLVRKQADAKQLVLDTRDLTIERVESAVGDQWQSTTFTLDEADEANAHFGSALRIDVPSKAQKLKVHYSTSPEASGLQWLLPEQTAGKKQPFLFTQAQAIHARSFIPLQDTPQVRVTFDATLRTPKALRAVMGAENDLKDERNGVFHFNMPQAIPSYLIALAVGDLEFKAMGPRTGVYAEPSVLESAAKEFEDTEKMLEATEATFGPYSWGRYDLLILPPSFPFGGMENPRLSFITPTVIAGDKSLVALIAHELAHSWSGNTVTNATWRDLWLNEGFTTYLTYRIMEIIYGERRFDMERVLGYQDLEKSVATQTSKDQWLAMDVRGRDPDDAFSNIPYEKGALFITELEHAVGREAFDVFLKQYLQDFAFTSLYTEEFLAYLDNNLLQKYPSKVSMERVKEWVYQPGFPSGAPQLSSNAFDLVDEARTLWLNGKRSAQKTDTANWTVHEWLYFLNNFPNALPHAQLAELDQAFDLTASKNNEVAHSWLLLAIKNGYAAVNDRLHDYLVEVGRKKLIQPLYTELVKSAEGLDFARKVYRIARPGYHPIAQNTMDKIVIGSDWSVSAPPGKWKTVEINTNETTWSFVDLSPDGKTLVFDMLGDLYKVSIDGGKAEALTEGIAWSYQARFSPNGQEIAFISDRDGADNIWVIDADGGNPRQISSESWKTDGTHNLHTPYWTPDGQWIAARKGYVSRRSIPAGAIWMYHRSGGQGSMMVDRLHDAASEKNIVEPSFSPDGKTMYFSQDITSGVKWLYNKDATGSVHAIKKMDLDSGDIETYISGAGGAIRAIPSHDGKSLAFIKRLPNMRSALYVKDIHSGNERAVYSKLDRDNQETTGTHGNYPAYAWTPDNKKIIIWSDGHIQSIEIDSGKATVIPVEINAIRKIRKSLRSEVAVAPNEFDVKMPRWAQYTPDKKAVVFQALGHLYKHAQNKRLDEVLTRASNFHAQRRVFALGGGQSIHSMVERSQFIFHHPQRTGHQK